MKYPEDYTNKVICGDCLELMKDIPNKSIDLVLTDPPYVIGAKGQGLAGKRNYLIDMADKGLSNGFDLIILEDFKRILKEMNIIIFCSRLQIKDYLDWIYKNNYTWNIITWHKTNPIPLTNNNYLPDTEYIFHIWNNRKLSGNYKTKKKYYIQPIKKNNFNHPTVKPLNIIKNLLENATQKNDIVLDPFLGSGTTAVACKALDRRFIGIEISSEYCKIAEERLKVIKKDSKQLNL